MNCFYELTVFSDIRLTISSLEDTYRVVPNGNKGYFHTWCVHDFDARHRQDGDNRGTGWSLIIRERPNSLSIKQT